MADRKGQIRFKYAEPQWKVIARELPKVADRWFHENYDCKVDVELIRRDAAWIREDLEVWAGAYTSGILFNLTAQSVGYPGEAEEIRDLIAIAQDLNLRLKQLSEPRPCGDRLGLIVLDGRSFMLNHIGLVKNDTPQQLLTLIDEFVKGGKRRLIEIRDSQREPYYSQKQNFGHIHIEREWRKTKRIAEREALYIYISQIFELWMMRGGCLRVSSTPDGGPLTRFLQASTKPVLGRCLTPDAIRKYVRKARHHKFGWLIQSQHSFGDPRHHLKWAHVVCDSANGDISYLR